MKKLLIAASVLGCVAATSASANTFSGPAVGVQLGVSTMNYKIGTGFFGDTAFGSVAKARGTGFNGRVFGQWGTVRGSLVFGVDLGVGYDTAAPKKSVTGTGATLGLSTAQVNSLMGNYKQFGTALTTASTFTFTHKLKNSMFIAPGVRVGGVIGGKTLIFGRLGVNCQFQKLETTITSGTASATFKDNMMTTSVVPGVGVDYMVNDNVFVRGQLDYAIGVSVSGNRSGFTKKPNTFTATAGVGYQF